MTTQPSIDPGSVSELVSVFSAVFWGPLISICLFGITITQAWTYFITNQDKWLLRLVVALLVVLDFINVVLVSELIKYEFLDNYCNPLGLLINPRYIAFEAMFTYIIAFIVQLFFASRVYYFKRSKANYIGIFVIITTAVGSFVPGMVSAVGSYRHPEISYYNVRHMKILIGLFVGIGAVCDISVTVLLSWNLYQSKSKSAVQRTNNIIQRLVIYIVTRGFAVSALRTANLIVYLSDSESLTWAAIHFCLSRIYVITILAILNSRSPLRNKLHQEDVSDINFQLSTGDTNTRVHPTFPIGSTADIHGTMNDVELSTIEWKQTSRSL